MTSRNRVVICALAAVGALSAPCVARAADLRVPQDFATIQAAIDAAQPFDRILVKGGVYPGTVTVDVANLEILGKGKVVVDAGGVGNGIAIGAANVTLRRLRVRNAGLLGISVQTSGARILDCRVEDSPTGIGASASRLEIAGCTLEDVEDGIFIQGDDCVVRKNRMRRVESIAIGIVGDRNTTSANDLADITSTAIDLTGVSNLVSDIVVRDCLIGITSSGDGFLTDCRVDRCQIGMSADGDRIVFHGNAISKSGSDAIAISSTEEARITRNRVRQSGEEGISLVFVDDSLVSENDVRHVAGFGILLVSSDDNTVAGNVVRDAGTEGLAEITGATGNVFVANDVK